MTNASNSVFQRWSELELSRTSKIMTSEESKGAGSLSGIDHDISMATAEDEGHVEELSKFIRMPGGQHSLQIMAEPESMDMNTGDTKDKGGDKGRVYWLKYQSIDQETQAGDLTEEIRFQSMEPVALGGYSDIHMGRWIHPVSIDKQSHQAITVVALKVLRAFTRRQVDLDRAKRHLRKETLVWKRLRHENIARFYGVSFKDGRPAVVMQWYQNGTAPQFLKGRSEMERFEMVKQVAQGLRYLHIDAKGIVHGDIKGNNILVSDDGYALLSDFGLARLVDEYAGRDRNTTTMAGSLRWQAPELLCMDEDEPDFSKTLESDIWAFACTVFELLDDNLPYHWYNYDYGIMRAIYTNQKPVRDGDERSKLSKGLSKVLGICWGQKTERPGIDEVIEKLIVDRFLYQ